jgi:ABC-type antimicrobial peptide transport system permease subunit
MINLTVISDNNKTITTQSLLDMSQTTFNNSQIVSLPYDNSIINIHTSTSSYSIQNLINSFTGFSGQLNFFIVIIILIAFIIGAFSLLKKVK